MIDEPLIHGGRQPLQRKVVLLCEGAQAGGVSEPLTTLGEGEVAHLAPDVLPNGEAALFTVRTGADGDQIALVALDTRDRRSLSLQGTRPRYVSTGHIIFARDNALWAVPFDADRQEVTGLPVPVLEDVPVSNNNGYDQAAVAKNGTLMYLAGSVRNSNRSLVWVDRDGAEEAFATEPRLYAAPRVAPDGTRVAV